MLTDAIRSLRRSRSTTLFVLLILTLSIAAATVTFSVVDAVVLRPLPFPQPARLFALEHQRGDRVMAQVRSFAAVQFLALRDQLEPAATLAAVARGSDSLGAEDGSSEQVWSARVTASLFEVLHVSPLLGQPFSAEQEVPGNDVAVIAYDLWRRRFNSDPRVIGRTLKTTSKSLRVVAVMPEGFSYPLWDDRVTEIWVPYVIPAAERSTQQMSSYLHVLGRSRGAQQGELQARADAVRQGLSAAEPQLYKAGGRFAVEPLREWTVGPIAGWMMLILVAIALVLLIACANVANLLLSRALDRARELGIRAALGATRGRLIASLLLESVILSAGAVGLALLVSWWGVEAVRNALPPGIARAAFIALNLRVFAAAVLASVVCAGIVGVIPAFQAVRHDLVVTLKSTTGGSTGDRTAGRRALLVAEIAFTAVLLVATTLFVSSFVRLVRTDLGFDRARLLVVTEAQGVQGSIGDFADRLKAVPGVAAVGGAAAGSPPLIAAGFSGGSSGTMLRLPGAPADAGVGVEFNRVTPEYFAAAAIPVRRGRVFDSNELAASMSRADLANVRVAMIDELAAGRLFGDKEPLGREVLYGNSRATIVGIVAHVKMRGPEADVAPQAYFPGPITASSYAYLVRTTTDAADMIPRVSDAIGTMVDPGSRAVVVRPVEGAFRNITARRRFSAGAMTVFAVLAVVIGASGVFAVMSSLVRQRTREIGVQMALGATPRRMIREVLAQISGHLAVGLALGLPAGWLVTRTFEGVFFEVRSTDLWVYALVGCGLLALGLAAAFGPARRASRVDPLISLRSE